MRAIIFGGNSDMAKPIAKLFDGTVLVDKDKCDVRNYWDVYLEIKQQDFVDVVIDLAGISNVQFIKDSIVESWADEIAVNLLGAYYISKAAIERNPDVTIIHIGSVAGMYGKPQHSGYCASKAGVISLVQSLGKEGYNAYAISPGRVDTKMREADYPGEDPRTRLKTSEIARVVKEIMADRHMPGDNIVIRKRGFRTLRRVDKGEPWHTYLKVAPINNK